MIEREDIVTAVLAAADGPLTSRVRLQKVVYLLDQLGLNSRFDYDYWHYGPYSRDLDNATADAKAFDLVKETFEHRKSDGAMYSIFTSKGAAKPEAYGKLAPRKVKELVQVFVKTNVTVLELAATVDWLWRYEKRKDWQSEITRRKALKVRAGRLDEAVGLLKSIGLEPPPPTAN